MFFNWYPLHYICIIILINNNYTMTTPKPAVKKPEVTSAKNDKKAQRAKNGKSTKNVVLDAQNNEETKKAITDKKDLMYLYPKDCTTLAKRKKFRHSIRGKNETFLKAITKLEESTDKNAKTELKAKLAEYEQFRKEHYVKP